MGTRAFPFRGRGAVPLAMTVVSQPVMGSIPIRVKLTGGLPVAVAQRSGRFGPVATVLPIMKAGLGNDRFGPGRPVIENVGDAAHGVVLENRPPCRGTSCGTVLAGVEDVSEASREIAIIEAVFPLEIRGRVGHAFVEPWLVLAWASSGS